jgi:hypothetical protein
VLPGAESTAFAVRWGEDAERGDFLLGRRAFPYERLDVPLLEIEGPGVRMYARGQWKMLDVNGSTVGGIPNA